MEFLEVELEPDFRDASFDFEDESGKGVGFALHGFKIAFVQCLLMLFHAGLFNFVVDSPHDFLNHILHGNQARSAAVFVDDDGDMDFLLAEILEEVINFAVL